MNEKITLPEGNAFGKYYLQWKHWDTGRLVESISNYRRAYFSAEIKRTHLERIHNVLEIGFGNGEFLTYAKEQGWNIKGVESNEYLLEIAQKAGFDAMPDTALPDIENGFFDLIVAFDVLEHIPQSQIPHFLSTIQDKLRPGGVLLARFPNGDSPFGLANQNGDITHVTVLGLHKIEYFAVVTGFTIVFIGADAWPVCCGRLDYTLYRMLTNPLKKVLEFMTRMLFFPNERITFYSSNLVVVYRKNAHV